MAANRPSEGVNLRALRIPIVLMVFGLAAVGGAFWVQGHKGGPARTASQFVNAIERNDHDELYSLLSYKSLIVDRVLHGELMSELHRQQLVGLKIISQGYSRNSPGLLPRHDQYNVILEFASEAISVAEWTVTLVNEDDAWKVDFTPTYVNLLSAQHGWGTGSSILQDVWRQTVQQAS